MSIRKIFLKNAKENYIKSKGYQWKKLEDSEVLYDLKDTKILTFKNNNDLIIHNTEEIETITNLLDLARVESFLSKM